MRRVNRQATLHLAFLGQPEIRLDGDLLVARAPAKGVALLAYLAVTGQSCSRESLAGLLWGETPDAAARASLRVTLNRLPAELRPFLTLTPHAIALDVSWVTVDVHALETAVSAPPTAWQTAVSLYRGDFLEGLTLTDAPAFEEWALLERERLRLLVIDLLHRLSVDARQRQAYAEGIVYARRSLALDNWREEAHRLLMHLLALDGQRSDALAQFESCRRLLAENLAVQPAPETLALYEAIKTNTLSPPPLPSLSTASPLPIPHNLPASAAAFVGREVELGQLASLLAQPDGRLITILGPGGAGKTRLALEAATRRLADARFPDGLFFVPLADHPPETAVAPLIAEAVGLKLNSATQPEEQLRRHLRPCRLLLLLDNFEHLLPQAGLVADLLAAAPGLRVIVTSRERLALYEEWLVEIGGLEWPATAVADWANYDAPQLFIQRARRVYLRFDSAAEREAILHICQLVGGLPLALELAAAWVRTVPCRDIAQMIVTNLGALRSEWRNAPERQRSLQAAFNYSWALLPEAEQTMLARLAVFRGGFAAEAMRAITEEIKTNRAGRGDLRENAAPATSLPSLLRYLSALVDKSLVQRQPDGRYQLHEAIRLSAQEKAGPEEWAQARAAHGRYYAALLAEQGGKSGGAEAEAAFRVMALELENGRFAWQWVLVTWPESSPLLNQLLPPLSLFYLRRGRSLEAVAWLGEALETVAGAEPMAARLQHQYAKHEEGLGRFVQAQERLLACLPTLAAAGLTAYAADAWEILGRTQRHLGDLVAAEASFRHSLAQHRLTGRPSSIAGVLNSLGVLAKNDGRYAEAAAYYGESLTIFRQQGDQAGVAVCLINLGNIANVQGDYEQARLCYQESYELAAAAEHRPNMAINLLNLGSVARVTGDLAAAGQHYRDSLALGREMGRGLIVATALDGLGQTLLQAGDLAEARAVLRVALETAASLNSESTILIILASAGRAMVQTGQLDGVRLLATVLQQPGTAHYVKQEIAVYAAEIGLDLNQTAAALTVTAGIQCALDWL